MDSQNRRGPSKILVMRLKHPQNMVFLELGQGYPSSGLGGGLYGGALDTLRQILGEDHGMRRERQGPLNRMLELANVSRPPIPIEQCHCLRRDAAHRR